MKKNNTIELDIMVIIALFTIYFLSGLCALIDEVIWVRLIKLSLGNTVYASSIVVSVFMGGLALGALIMARYAHRIKKPLKTYALLEACATVLALSVPFLLKFAEHAYALLFNFLGPSSKVLFIVQFLVAALTILIPTILMGSTLPLVGLFITRTSSTVGKIVGRLYAINTFGAAVGCYLAGFVFLRHTGIMETLYITAAINLVVAIAGWLLSLNYDGITVERKNDNAVAENSVDQKSATFSAVFLLGCFISGFISIGYELVWMRSIVIPLGGYTYVFSSVLTIYLIGNVIGAWIGSFIAKNVTYPSRWFGLGLLVLGLFGITFIPWFVTWVQLNPFIVKFSGDSIRNPEFVAIPLRLLHSAILFLPSSIVMGIGFPLALQGWKSQARNTGFVVGNVYGVNTIGAVIGGLFVGFFLIPGLGIHYSMIVLGLLGVWFGAAIYGNSILVKKKCVAILFPMLLLAVTAGAFMIPSNLFKRAILAREGECLLYVDEGVTTTVSVTQDYEGYRQLGVDGIYMAGDDEHRCAQKTLGHLGLLLNKNAKDILSIGFGCGETSLCISYHKPDSITCVEIAKEVTGAALKYFKNINLGDLLSTFVVLYHMDAKNFLHLTKKKFDLIINDSDIHQSAGSAPLYTVEHFNNAKKHLKQGGLCITKLHIYMQPEPVIKSIVSTFSAAFPHVTIWFPTTRPYLFFYLVGSNEKQVFSPDHINKELKKPDVKNSLDYLNISSSTDLAAWYIGDEGDLVNFANFSHVNSDYYPFVEFTIAANDHYYHTIINSVRSRSLLEHLDWENIDSTQKDAWMSDFAKIYQAATNFLQVQHRDRSDFFEDLRNLDEAVALCPEQKGFVNENVAYVKKAMGEIARGTVSAPTMLNNLRTQFTEAQQNLSTMLLFKSLLLSSVGNHREAFTAAEAAAKGSPKNAKVVLNLCRVLFQDNKADSATALALQALLMEPNNPELLFNVGSLFDNFGLSNEALRLYSEFLKKRPDDIYTLCHMGNIYKRLNRKDEAIASFKKVMTLFPEFQPAVNGLKETQSLR
jgi:spermidine synthase